jgi:hypothetical protein
MRSQVKRALVAAGITLAICVRSGSALGARQAEGSSQRGHNPQGGRNEYE